MSTRRAPEAVAAAFLDGLARRLPVHRRVALLAAHPDDEVVGAGAQLPLLTGLALLHLTDGAPADPGDAHAAGFADGAAYAAARRRELSAALAAAGIAPRRRRLGLTDQQVVLALAPLARRLARLLGELGSEILLTHPYEGGHPDHDAAAFAASAATRLLRRAGRPAPAVIEMACYHRDGAGAMRTGTFLPGSGRAGVTIRLRPAERAAKRRLVGCFPSQARVLAQFDLGTERFRPAPAYDFRRPPQPGPLLYEGWGFALDGAAWRRHAAAAGRALGLGS
ncbi:MAG: PIG-L family deacetylase [Dongiaceae bacterium]